MPQGELIVEVQSGVTDRPSLSLHPGEPLEPLSLGRNAFWQILADGVSSVQAFIYFDGDAVFIASADLTNPAVAAGALVSGDWTELTAPCEIRLGHAVLLLRSADQVAPPRGYSQRNLSSSSIERPAEMDFEEGEFSTARVDGHHLDAELRKRKPRISVPVDDEPTRTAEPPTAPVQISQRKSRRKPKIRVPKAEEATLYRPIEEPATTPWRESELTEPETRPVSLDTRPVALQQVATAPGPFPAVVNPLVQGGVQQRRSAPMPVQPQPSASPLQRPSTTPGFVPPGVGQVPAASGPQPAPIGMSLAGQPLGAAANPLAKTSPGDTSRMAAQGSGARVRAALGKAEQAWKQANLPQKAILCLLPVAFVAVFVMFGDDDTSAQRTKPNAQSSAVAAVSGAPSASGATGARALPTLSASADTTAAASSSVAPSSAKPATAATGATAATASSAAADKGPHPTSGKGAPPRSLERQASDAVAAGSFSDALKLYEQLAAQHPDMAVYKEAARILKTKMADAK